MDSPSNAARILSPASGEAGDWRADMRNHLRDVHELWHLLALDPALLPGAIEATRQFPLRLPRRLLAMIEAGNAHDPILRQYLPLDRENDRVSGYTTDPVGDLASVSQPGLLHKYQGRALLMTTGACAVHCRYCFRRHFPYADNLQSGWDGAIAQLHAAPDISEIILSGGDPLALSDDKLEALIQQLGAVPHLIRLRIHSRLPVVLPSRITERLLHTLTQQRLSVVFVIHANHASELDSEFAQAMQRLKPVVAALLNQSVLLAGVNDHAATLAQLSEQLFAAGVLPYYLHQLDPVQGAAHFQVTDPIAVQLMRKLSATLPGYLVPRLVREISGGDYKQPLAW